MSLVTEDHRAIIIVDAGKISAANNYAASWDPDIGGGETFGTTPGLSTDGTKPATHFGANTAATTEMRQGILNASTNVPFVSVYWSSGGWGWNSALDDQGLVRISTGP